MTRSLTLTESQHTQLKEHLFPTDQCESAAILICRFVGPDADRLIVNDTILVPDNACTARTPTFVSWPGEWVERAIDQAETYTDAILLLHSHPGGVLAFSSVDDDSDFVTMRALNAAIEGGGYHHGSGIMTPNGSMKVRLYDSELTTADIEYISRVGIDVHDISAPERVKIMPFGSEMRSTFGKRTACVIGVSGTGSIVTELLARKGLGHIVLIDFDNVKHKNLNRIVNSTYQDAEDNRSKTEMMAAAIARYNSDIKVTCIDASITDRNAIIVASSADILFSCVDSMLGRSIAESISQACLIPLIDLGVTIPTRVDPEGTIQIADICGRIDYMRPDGPSLSDRGVVTPEGLRREYLLDNAPDAARLEMEAGYIKGTHEEAPSVMALNMRAACDAVTEWLARQFGYRHDGNEPFARSLFSLAGGEIDYEREDDFFCAASPLLAQGLVEPLLGLPNLALPKKREAA